MILTQCLTAEDERINNERKSDDGLISRAQRPTADNMRERIVLQKPLQSPKFKPAET